MNLLIPGMGILKGWGNQVLKIAWGGGGAAGNKRNCLSEAEPLLYEER